MGIEVLKDCVPPKGIYVGGTVVYTHPEGALVVEYSPLQRSLVDEVFRHKGNCVMEQCRTDPTRIKEAIQRPTEHPCYKCNRRVTCQLVPLPEPAPVTVKPSQPESQP